MRPFFLFAVSCLLMHAVEPPPSLANLKLAAEYNVRTGGVSMLVMHQGQIIFEDYPIRWSLEAGPDRFWGCASGTKGFNGPMAALMAADGLIDPDRHYADPFEEPAHLTITEWADPQAYPAHYRQITIRHLLSLTSGLDANYSAGRPEPCTYAESIQAPIHAQSTGPGTYWQYGANPFQIWGEIARRKLMAAGIGGAHPDPIEDYLKPRILDRIGASYASWKGTTNAWGGKDKWLPQGSEWTPRTWAPWGELMRLGGTWDTQLLIPQDLLDLCFVGSAIRSSYGISWWLDSGATAITGDMISVLGAGGQDLFVSRLLGLVVIRQTASTSNDPSFMSARSTWFNSDFFDLLRYGQLQDPDRDGDLIPDARDHWPDDPAEWVDADEDTRPEVTARDGLGDNFEQMIIDADPNDALTRIQHVAPSGDADGDGVSNLTEFQTQHRSVTLELVDGHCWRCTSETRGAVRSVSGCTFSYLADDQVQTFVPVVPEGLQ